MRVCDVHRVAALNHATFLFEERLPGISCSIEEVAGHMDKTSIDVSRPYSLHTEYSYGKRKLNSPILQHHLVLKHVNKYGIPQLWKNEARSKNFFEFIQALIGDGAPPEVIEIHPPFDDYCSSIDHFLDVYEPFEKSVLEVDPNTIICVENRAGTLYRGGKFLLSGFDSISQLCGDIHSRELNLRLALDYPQLYTAEHYNLEQFPIDHFIEHHRILKQHRPLISSIHIWGKTKRANSGWTAHNGDLNSLFCNDFLAKRKFLDYLIAFYDDNKPRYFVPEVNSSVADLQSIVNDFIDAGADFT
ncbi:MAG: hypothetical protein ACXW1E_06990 [Halobacteriota archaeon]